MKRIIYIAAVLLSSFAASAATIRIEPATSATSIGGAVDISVQIADVADLYGYQFDVAFNAAILSASTVFEGSFLAGGGNTLFIPGAIDNILGTITLTAGVLQGPVPGVSGSGPLATLRFTGLADGTSTIALSNAVLVNSASSDIAATTQSGSVSVGIPEPATGFMAALALLAITFAAPTGKSSKLI